MVEDVEEEKKYRYSIVQSAVGTTKGTLILTEKEAKIVNYAVNISNWDDLELESWSGGCHICIDNPEEV